MTPESAAAFLRSQADAILATGEPVSLRLEVRPISEPRDPLSSAERSARQRARERLENGTKRDGASTGDLKEGGPDLGSKEAKTAEKKPDQKQATSSQVSLAVVGGTTRDLGASRPTAASEPRAGRPWRRVPGDWTIKPDQRSLALGLLVDVELEADKFRDHEFATPKRDPDATFRNWIRNAAKRPGAFAQRNKPKTDLQEILERADRIQKGAAE